MARDIKLDIIYINKKGVQCELEGSFSKETDFKNCMDRIKAEIETLEAFRLFKKKREPQQLKLDLI
tara:strand:+ start:382 stop:579 length:198 start_codon:yes stop_codon:yes gene_type:complete